MTLSQAATNVLDQLAGLVKQIHEKDFNRPSEILNGSTIGQHIRHTVEFFLCFESGCKEFRIAASSLPYARARASRF